MKETTRWSSGISLKMPHRILESSQNRRPARCQHRSEPTSRSDEVSVEVIGRLYDFEITDIADYNWELVFRRFKNSLAPTWISYWTGTQDIDGDKRGNKPQFTVPIRPAVTPCKGIRMWLWKRDITSSLILKPKATCSGPRDGIRLTPTFDFVSKDGKHACPWICITPPTSELYSYRFDRGSSEAVRDFQWSVTSSSVRTTTRYSDVQI